jgi:hypothetical protein
VSSAKRRALLTGLSAILLASCANECDTAQDQLDSCRDDIARAGGVRSFFALLGTDGTEACSPQNRCVAECVNGASCPAIASLSALGQADPNQPLPAGAVELSHCMKACR